MPAETARRPDTEGAGVIWPAAAPGGQGGRLCYDDVLGKGGAPGRAAGAPSGGCLELVLNKEAAGYAFLFARVALHADINGERQVIRGRKPETNLAAS